MKNYMSRFALIVLCLTTISKVALARAGGSSDGGGTSCVNPAVNGGHPTLLDLARAGFQDEGGEKLLQTDVVRAVGFDEFNYKQTQAFQFALSRVQLWEGLNLTPKFSEFKSTLKNLRIYMTRFSPVKVNRAALDGNSVCTYDQLKPIIFYFNGRVHISITAWNGLGLYSQAGAFVHEALRQRQILHGDKISDQTLQRITEEIIFGGVNQQGVLKNELSLIDVPDSPDVNFALDSLCSSYKSSIIKMNDEITPRLKTSADTRKIVEKMKAVARKLKFTCEERSFFSSPEQSIQYLQSIIDILKDTLLIAANNGRSDISTEIESVFQKVIQAENANTGELTMTAIDQAKDSASWLEAYSNDGMFLMKVRNYLKSPSNTPSGFEQTMEQVKNSYKQMIVY